jgi:ferric-dicitrate binding protein FerR (iron transport regulator)
MSRKKKAAAAGSTVASTVSAVKDNPQVQRLVTDEDVRDNVRVAFESAKQAYERVASAKKPPKALLNDKKLHQDLQDAAEALRDVGAALKITPAPKKRRGGVGRKLLLLVVGAGAAVALSSDVRNKVLDLLFGAEEEFDYTSTTSPSPPPAA